MVHLVEASNQDVGLATMLNDIEIEDFVHVSPLLTKHGEYKGLVFSLLPNQEMALAIISKGINYVQIATPAAFPNVLKLIGTFDHCDPRSFEFRHYKNGRVELSLLDKQIPETFRCRLSGNLRLPCRLSRHGVLSVLTSKRVDQAV